MKRRRVRKKKKILIPLLILTLVLSILMSVSYAILSKKLNVGGNINLSKKISPSEYIISVLGTPSNGNNLGFRIDSASNEMFFNGSSPQNYFKIGNQSTLWRIISINNNEIRIIREADTSLSSSWTTNNSSWENSNILAALKNYYNQNLLSYNSLIVQNPSFEIGEARTNKAQNYTSSYNYTASPVGTVGAKEVSRSNQGGSWMTASTPFWTSTSIRSTVNAFRFNSDGKFRSSLKTSSFMVRPVIALYHKGSLSGTGTMSDPFKF